METKERISRRCWKKFESESLFAQYSPFFISFAAGDWAPQAFDRCISQELHFLKASVNACVWEGCLNDDGEKMVVRHLRNSLLQRIHTHIKLVQEWGFELPKQHFCYVAIVNYRQFLLNTTSGKVGGNQIPCKRKIAAYTLGAIIPCIRLYSHLFHQIQNIPDRYAHTTRLYKKWIDFYCSQDFEVSIMQAQYTLDKLSDCFAADEGVMEKVYHRAVKLQVEFLPKIPTYKRTLVPLSRLQDLRKHKLTIFCDFNMTCTVAETESSFVLAKKSITSTELETWSVLANQSSKEFQQCFKKIMSGVTGQQVLVDYIDLWCALDRVAECETRTIARLEQSRLLQGLSLEDIRSVASHVILQNGCRRFFRKIAKNESPNIDVHIISNCWCADLIRLVLSPEISVRNLHSNV